MYTETYTNIDGFLNYFNSFYGVDGIYSSGRNVSKFEIEEAVDLLPDFQGDSLDREHVRDIVFTQDEIELMYAGGVS